MRRCPSKSPCKWRLVPLLQTAVENCLPNGSLWRFCKSPKLFSLANPALTAIPICKPVVRCHEPLQNRHSPPPEGWNPLCRLQTWHKLPSRSPFFASHSQTRRSPPPPLANPSTNAEEVLARLKSAETSAPAGLKSARTLPSPAARTLIYLRPPATRQSALFALGCFTPCRVASMRYTVDSCQRSISHISCALS